MKIWEKESHRVEKVASEMKNRLAIRVQELLRELGLDFQVSIIEINLPKDLRSAKVFYSVLSLNPEDQERDLKEVGNILKDHRSELGKQITHDLNLKYIPKLLFVYKKTFDHTLENLFQKIKK